MNELKCKCGCGLNVTDIGIVHRVQVICDVLAKIVSEVRNIEDFRIILKINSATRCWKHHEHIYNMENIIRKKQGLPLLEVPKNSYHLPQEDGKSKAIDCSFYVKEKGVIKGLLEIEKKLLNKILYYWSGGMHYYKDKNFWHLDIGEYRRW